MLVATIAGLVGVAQVTWGFQLAMTCLETILIEVTLIVLIIIESRSAKVYTAKEGEYIILEPSKSELSDGESRMLLLNRDPDTKRKYMRDIIKVVRHGKGEAYTDLFETPKPLERTLSLPWIPNVEKAPD